MTKYVPQHLAARAGRAENTRMSAVALRGSRNAVALTAASALPVGAGVLVATPALADPAPQKPADAKPTLSFNSTGTSVIEVQSLIALVRDGVYGPVTAAAVKNFQSANGLTVDGVVGAQTWAALGQASTQPHATVGTPNAIVTTGDSGSDVRSLQKMLRITADGVYGSKTEQAVRDFQIKHKLLVDGIVGPETATALVNKTVESAKSSAAKSSTAKSSGATASDRDGEAATSTSRSNVRVAPAQPKLADPDAAYELPFPPGAGYMITQGPYGSTSHYKTNDKHHVDFATPVGSSVVSSAAGTVYSSTYNETGGKTLLIQDASGYCMEYAHLDRVSVVPGQRVAQGEYVGASGATGEGITGPHLHWGLVDCSSYASIRIADSKELGTSYVPGALAYSRNEG